MKSVYKIGDRKEYSVVVTKNDVATFHGNVVHEVYSTFAIGRDMEWTTRQFVLDMKEEDEEGIGTFLNIQHKAPAFIGEEIIFTGEITGLRNHEIICDVTAKVNDRIVAIGETGQKILKKEKIKTIFAALRNANK
jgi:fluoroacetyl-CoA thioesterase